MKFFIVKLTGSFLLLLTLCHAVSAQIAATVVEKAAAATVKMFGIDPISQRQNSAQFSGVVIDAQGYILTVAHAVKPGNSYRVIFPSGQLGIAKALGRIVFDPSTMQPDVAMMQLEGEDSWPFATLGWSSSMVSGYPCFGWSYPESLGLNLPFLRVGNVVQTMNQFNFLESTCIMETGDSGGPLFDALGRVVALHSRIDAPEGVSYEVPVDTYRMYWDSLKIAKEYTLPSMASQQVAKDSRRQELVSIKKRMQNITPQLHDVQQTVWNISSTLAGVTREILGTVFLLPNGGQVLLSKSSEIGDHPTVHVDGKKISLAVIKRDRTTDLVLLHSSFAFPQSIYVDKMKVELSQKSIGLPIFSKTTAGVKEGVVGMVAVEMQNRFSGGNPGVRLQEIDGLPTVTAVDNTISGAVLQVGDRMLKINDQDVSSAQKINAVLSQYFVGDTVRVEFLRGEQIIKEALPLGIRTFREENHDMNRFIGGKSIRRDGFDQVFIHDGSVHSFECGSPIFSKEGIFVGFNIARFSHTATIAIPANKVFDFIRSKTTNDSKS